MNNDSRPYFRGPPTPLQSSLELPKFSLPSDTHHPLKTAGIRGFWLRYSCTRGWRPPTPQKSASSSQDPHLPTLMRILIVCQGGVIMIAHLPVRQPCPMADGAGRPHTGAWVSPRPPRPATSSRQQRRHQAAKTTAPRTGSQCQCAESTECMSAFVRIRVSKVPDKRSDHWVTQG
jgi:hypothetical protein